MTGYRLGVFHGALVSRSQAAETWAEVDCGKTRWLLWAKDPCDAERIVEGTPVGYLGLLKQVVMIKVGTVTYLK